MAKQRPQPKQVIQQVSPRQTTQVATNQPTDSQVFSFDERYIPAILAALIFVSYIPVWQNEFVWDDKPYILLSDMVKNFDLNAIFTEYAVGNYHPFTMLSFAIEYALVKEQTWLYHLDNLVLHTINSWLVFRLLQKLNGNFLTSIVTAVLFAIHPLHVESVAWAAEQIKIKSVVILVMICNFIP